jgi:hypothetical protein
MATNMCSAARIATCTPAASALPGHVLAGYYYYYYYCYYYPWYR